MKQLNLLFITLAFVFTIACDKDDDIQEDTNKDLIGSWVLQPVDYNGAFSAVVNTDDGTFPVIGSFTGNSLNENYIITFEENPNEVFSTGSFGMDLEISPMLLDEKVPVKIESFELPNSNGTWIKEGKTLTLIEGDIAILAEIVELTTTNLVLKFSPEDLNISDQMESDIITDLVISQAIEIPFIKK